MTSLGCDDFHCFIGLISKRHSLSPNESPPHSAHFRKMHPTLNAFENYQVVMETPIFVQKLFKLVESGEDIIGWRPNGDTFIVHDSDRLQNELLPLYFKLSKFNSFVRQLHFYGFSKTTLSSSLIEFSHPFFIKNRPDMLALIVRKTNENGNAQKRHIQELNERIQKLEQENALLRARVDVLSKTSRPLADQAKPVLKPCNSSSPKSQVSMSDQSSAFSALLLALPGQNLANSAFKAQKRFRSLVVQSH